jgi:hypothetical protein
MFYGRTVKDSGAAWIRGILSVNDEKIAEWKHDWLPNLMGSEVGNWMLENNLTEYYCERMNKDLREAAVKIRKSPVTSPAAPE